MSTGRRLLMRAALLVLVLAPPPGADAARYTGTIYADNWFRLYVNGRQVAVDPVRFIPHNAVSFTFEDSE